MCILGSKKGLPGSSAGKESACNAGNPGVIPGKFPWRRDRLPTAVFLGFPDGSDGKESACSAGGLGLIPGLRRSPAWQPTPIFLPGESPWTEEPGGLQSTGRRVPHA